MLTGILLLLMLAVATLASLYQLWQRLSEAQSIALAMQDQLKHTNVQLQDLSSGHGRLERQIDRLANDVRNRTVYQAEDRHVEKAVAAARQGMSLTALQSSHGLSRDEAELLVALHTVPSET